MQNGIVKGLDDGWISQAKRAKQAPMLWLTDQVIGEFETSGKDAAGRDLNVAADLDRHISRTLKQVGCADDGSARSAHAKAAAIETYGVTKELEARKIRPAFDTGEKFFGAGAENSPLFPALLASTFVVARLSAGLVDLLTFADVPVNRLSIDKVRLTETEASRRMRNVGIGSDLPRTTLAHVDTNVKMRKYGRLFDYAREVVSMQPLAIVQAMVAQIARQVAVDETDEVLEILHAGDGETGSAVTDTTPATDGSLVYADLLTLELAFNNSYAGRTYVATSAAFATILAMAEYKDPLANRNLGMDRGIPNLPTPTGMGRIYRWQSTNCTYMAETGGRIAAADPSLAAYVARTPMLEEQDTIISNGRQEVALSYMAAVVKGDPSAFKSLDITA